MRDDARRLVDELPEEDLPFLLRILRGLRAEPNAGLPGPLANAPEDDEPWTEKDEAAFQEGVRDIERGAVHSLDDVRRIIGA